MSRNFKFRAWHTDLQLMQDFSFNELQSCAIGATIEFEELNKGWVSINDKKLIIMQYLSEDCKDETGKEICEGDIVTNDYACGRLFKIVYSIGIWVGLGVNHDREIRVFDLIKSKGNKIIGNIYQNPELLQEIRS